MKYLTQKHISWVFTVFIVVLLLNCVCLPSAVAATSTWDGSSVDTDFQGSGTSESPYLITSAAELAGLAAASQTERFIGIYFQLTTSVDLGAGNWTPIGNARNPFEGFFDGGYHTISNLTFGGPENYIRFLPADPLYDPYGLFSQVEGGVLENLYLKNVGIYSNNKMVGGLVGRINSKDEEENLPASSKTVMCPASYLRTSETMTILSADMLAAWPAIPGLVITTLLVTMQKSTTAAVRRL